MGSEPTPTKRPGRPRRTGADRAILDATRRQLAAVGYARMSVDAIAAEAGTTKPTIYRRWPSKEALAVAALAGWPAEEAPAPRGDTLEDLKAALRDFRRALLRPDGMAMIGTVLAEESHVPGLADRFRSRVVRPRREAIRAILVAARGRKELAPDADIDAAVSALVGALHARYLAEGTIPANFPERAARVVLRGIQK